MTPGHAALFPPDSGPLSELTRTIAVLRHEPDEIAQRSKLQFKAGFNDLDELRWVTIEGRRGRYALVRHRHAPRPGTDVFISSASLDPRLDLLDVLSALHLSEEDLVWTHPDARRAQTARARAVVKRLKVILARKKISTASRTRLRGTSARAGGKKK